MVDNSGEKQRLITPTIDVIPPTINFSAAAPYKADKPIMGSCDKNTVMMGYQINSNTPEQFIPPLGVFNNGSWTLYLTASDCQKMQTPYTIIVIAFDANTSAPSDSASFTRGT